MVIRRMRVFVAEALDAGGKGQPVADIGAGHAGSAENAVQAADADRR